MPRTERAHRSPISDAPWGCQRVGLIDAALLIALVTVVLIVTHSYVASEQTFYFWDHAVFQDITWKTTVAFRDSPAAGFAELRRSYHDDYNALFAVPLVPFQLLFGESRLAYELALALVYFCPFALAAGGLATRLFIARPRLAFWTAAWLTLLVPMSWVPGLRGYPDAGAATLVVLALTIQMRDLESQRISPPFAIGVLLGLATLFRRHFVYAAIAFLAAMIAFSSMRTVARALRRQPSLRQLLRSARGVVLTISAMTGTVAVLGWGFVERLRDHDFLALYQGYEVPLADLLRWYLAPYGWLALVGATVGLVVGPLTASTNRARTGFLAVYAGISILQWCAAVRQVGEQYTLHFTPIVVLGLAALCFSGWRRLRGAAHAVFLVLAISFFAASAIVGLTVLDLSQDPAWWPLFAGKWGPLDREDRSEVLRFVGFLRQEAPAGGGIYVAGSSHVVNPDLVRHAEWSLVGRRNAVLDVLGVPEVDSRDYYPLGRLLDAAAVVVSEPVAYHLGPEAQRTIGVVSDLFTESRGLARDFAAIPATFSLEEGTRLRVYQRQHPTSITTALETLRIIESRLPIRPGMQPDWTVVARAFPWWLMQNPDGSASWVAHPTRRKDAGTATAIAYLGGGGEIEVSGRVRFVDPRCQGAALSFSRLDAEGRIALVSEIRRRPADDGAFKAVIPGASGRLLLSLLDYADGVSIDYCLMQIDPLATRPAAR